MVSVCVCFVYQEPTFTVRVSLAAANENPNHQVNVPFTKSELVQENNLDVIKNEIAQRLNPNWTKKFVIVTNNDDEINDSEAMIRYVESFIKTAKAGSDVEIALKLEYLPVKIEIDLRKGKCDESVKATIKRRDVLQESTFTFIEDMIGKKLSNGDWNKEYVITDVGGDGFTDASQFSAYLESYFDNNDRSNLLHFSLTRLFPVCIFSVFI